MGSVPISVIMGFDYPLGQATSHEDTKEIKNLENIYITSLLII